MRTTKGSGFALKSPKNKNGLEKNKMKKDYELKIKFLEEFIKRVAENKISYKDKYLISLLNEDEDCFNVLESYFTNIEEADERIAEGARSKPEELKEIPKQDDKDEGSINERLKELDNFYEDKIKEINLEIKKSEEELDEAMEELERLEKEKAEFVADDKVLNVENFEEVARVYSEFLDLEDKSLAPLQRDLLDLSTDALSLSMSLASKFPEIFDEVSIDMNLRKYAGLFVARTKLINEDIKK